MQGSESPPSPDLDDWFDEDDWFAEEGDEDASSRAPWPPREPQSASGRRLGDFTITIKALLVVGALLALVVVVVVLAVAGVFSSGKAHPPAAGPPKNVTTSNTTTAQTPTTPATTVAAPATTLKPGATGAQVKILQRALAKLGYSPGKVDGDYGPSTQTALKKFQQASKLAADGVLGPKTLRTLKSALAAG